MKKKAGKKHGTLRFLLLAVYSVLLIKHSGEIAEGVRTALARCLDVMIPSLFAFMAAADMLVRGGAYIYLSKPLRPLSRLMGLPEELGAVFLISNLAGYPAGAAAISAMYDSGRLDKKSAARLMCFCFNGGPAFFAGAAGTEVFGSAQTGLMVWLTVFAVNILAGAVIFRLFPVKVLTISDPEDTFPEGASLLTVSVNAAGKAMFSVCSMILFFSTVLALIKPLLLRAGMSAGTEALLTSFLEVSEVSSLSGSRQILLPAVCAAGAFGGVCVHLQIKALTGGRFPLLPFFAARAAAAVVSACAALPFSRAGSGAVPVSADIAPEVSADRIFPSLCLTAMMILTAAASKRGVRSAAHG